MEIVLLGSGIQKAKNVAACCRLEVRMEETSADSSDRIQCE